MYTELFNWVEYVYKAEFEMYKQKQIGKFQKLKNTTQQRQEDKISTITDVNQEDI